MNIEKHIKECVDKYKSGHSKLNEQALSMEGMIGSGARNMLNLLADFKGCRYMQIGTWKGACLYSALCGNDVEYAFACDNFAQFSHGFGASFVQDGKMITKMNLDSEVMMMLMQPEAEGETVEFEFYDGDCFSMSLSKVERPINMYFYDGGHRVSDHFMSLYYYYPILADEFIFVCDDWSEKEAQEGTMAAVEHCNYTIKSQQVYENLFIAHVVKDNWWGIRLTGDRMARKQTKKCKLDNKGIHTEDIR